MSFRAILFSGLIGSTLAGCGGGGGSDTGVLSLDVTDGPVDGADAVVVFFDAVTVQSGNGGRTTYGVTDPVTHEPGRSIDLLQLTGSKSVALLDTELTAGQYSWLRLDVDLDPAKSYFEKGGQRYELRCGSCDNNGLKLNRSFNVPADGVVAYTLDFDLRKSISDPQSGTYYNLRPTVRVVETALAGNIAGTVDTTLIAGLGGGPCAVYVYEGAGVTPNDIYIPNTGNIPVNWNNPVATASVEFDGLAFTYEAGYLPEGTYTTVLTCDALADDPAADDSGVVGFTGADDVPVTAGATTQKDFI
jgi:hypothetical protein